MNRRLVVHWWHKHNSFSENNSYRIQKTKEKDRGNLGFACQMRNYLVEKKGNGWGK